jgi:hypothetical protein
MQISRACKIQLTRVGRSVVIQLCVSNNAISTWVLVPLWGTAAILRSSVCKMEPPRDAAIQTCAPTLAWLYTTDKGTNLEEIVVIRRSIVYKTLSTLGQPRVAILKFVSTIAEKDGTARGTKSWARVATRRWSAWTIRPVPNTRRDVEILPCASIRADPNITEISWSPEESVAIRKKRAWF